MISQNIFLLFCWFALMWYYYLVSFFYYSGTLKKLSEESLNRPAEEVFDLLAKLGEG